MSDSPEIRPPSLKNRLAASVGAVRTLGDLRRDPAQGRKVLLWTIGIAVAATAVVTVVLTVLALTFVAGTADKLAAAGDVLVGATLFLAAIAALIALIAYAVSTGTPDLEIRITVPRDQYGNNPEFVGERVEHGLKAKEFGPLKAKILVRNENGYSARNPAVIIRLGGMFFSDRSSANEKAGWIAIDFIDISTVSAAQWDGGPAHPIHGNSTRRLPDLSLGNLHALLASGDHSLTAEILADGYRKTVTLPVIFDVYGEDPSPRPLRNTRGWL